MSLRKASRMSFWGWHMSRPEVRSSAESTVSHLNQNMCRAGDYRELHEEAAFPAALWGRAPLWPRSTLWCVEVNKTRGTLIAPLMGVNNKETCRHYLVCSRGWWLTWMLDVRPHRDQKLPKEVVEDINQLRWYLEFRRGSRHHVRIWPRTEPFHSENRKVLKRMREIKTELLQAKESSWIVPELKQNYRVWSDSWMRWVWKNSLHPGSPEKSSDWSADPHHLHWLEGSPGKKESCWLVRSTPHTRRSGT